MPKIKSHSGAKKRVMVTKTGKVIYIAAEDIDSILTLQCDVSN